MNRRATVLGTDSAGNLVLQLADSHLGTAPVPRPIVGSSTTGLHTAPPVGAQVLLLHEGEQMTPLPAAAVTASERRAGALAELRPGETALLGPDGRVALLLDRAGNIALASGGGGQGTLDGRPLLTAAELARREEAEMHWAGEWDDTASYFPGDVVRVGTSAYVCIQNSVGAPPHLDRSDTFGRPDQSGWGTSADGHTWTALGTDHGLESIASHRGLATTDVSDNADTLAFGGALARSSAELLVRWSVTVSGGGGDLLQLQLNTTPSLGAPCAVAMGLDGGLGAILTGTTDPTTGTWAGGTVGTRQRTRMRYAAGVLGVRTWPDDDPEPSAWDLQVRSGHALAAGFACVVNYSGAGTTIAFDSVAVYTLTAAPGEESTKWALLAQGA